MSQYLRTNTNHPHHIFIIHKVVTEGFLPYNKLHSFKVQIQVDLTSCLICSHQHHLFLSFLFLFFSFLLLSSQSFLSDLQRCGLCRINTIFIIFHVTTAPFHSLFAQNKKPRTTCIRIQHNTISVLQPGNWAILMAGMWAYKHQFFVLIFLFYLYSVSKR